MDKLKLVRVNNPFDKNSREVLERDYSGESISTIVGDVLPEVPCRVVLNGVEVAPDKWEFTFLKDSDKLVVVPAIAKGKEGLRMAAMVVVMVVSIWAGSAVSGMSSFQNGATVWGMGGSAWGAMASAAVSVAGGLLINMLMPLDTDTGTGSTLGNSYSWDPVMTQQQGVPISQVYGRMAVATGNIISAYRDLTKESPELYMLVSYGRGPIKSFSDIIINDQEIDTDDGISLYHRLGYMYQATVPGFETAKIESSIGAVLSIDTGTYVYPITSGVNGIEIDITFPNGCYHTHSGDGSTTSSAARFIIALQDEDGTSIAISKGELTTAELTPTGVWSFGEYVTQDGNTYWLEHSSQVSEPSSAELNSVSTLHPNAFWRFLGNYNTVNYVTGYSDEITLTHETYASVTDTIKAVRLDPTKSYTLRITRTNENEDATDGIDTTYLSAIRMYTDSAFTYPRTAILGVHGISSEKYSGSMQVTPTVEGRLVRVWDGAAWSVEYSTNPAWVCYDVLTQPIYDNDLNVLRFDGTHPDRVNLSDFYTWAQECDRLVPDGNGGTEKLFEFNGIFDGTSSTWESAVKVAGNFRADLYWNGIECRCAVNRKITTPVQIFTEGNITKGSFKENFASWDDRATEIEVTYKDEEKGWEQTTLSVIDSELTQVRNSINVQAFGTTKASQAWRIGKYLLANNKYIHRTISFQADIDALDCVIGDVIAFQHNIPNWGHGGSVKYAINGSPSEVVVDGFGADELYLQLGFSQAEIDAFTDSTVDIKNIGSDTGVLFQFRSLGGEYHEVAIYGGGVRNGDTVLQLQSGTNWEYIPTKGDPYAVSLDSFTSTKLFRVNGIVQESDFNMNISAMEYFPELFDDVDSVSPEIDIETSTAFELFPSVYNLASSDHVALDGANNQQRSLYISWSLPESNYYDHAKVYWRTRTPTGEVGEWKLAGEYWGRSADIRNVTEAKVYEIAVVTVNTSGDTAIFSLSPTITHFATGVVDYTNPILTDGVSNLRVENSTGDNITFQETDCHITWDGPAGDNFNTAFSDAFAQHSWTSEEWLKYYIVNIYDKDTSDLLYTTNVNIPYFDYTLALNQQVGLRREFLVGIIAEDQNDNRSPEIFIQPINYQAGQVTGVDTDSVFEGVECWWSKVDEYALSGYEVHVSQTRGFTPDSSTLYTTTDKDTLSTMLYLAEGQWYVKVGAFDVFGRDGITFSVEHATQVTHDVAATQVSSFFEEISKLYKVPVLEGDSWTVDTSDINWNEHTLYFDGIKYTIASGVTTDTYIYWNEGDSVLSTTDSQAVFDALDRDSGGWQIAKYYQTSGSFELAFNAQANAVIGTAMIADAAINNAKIGDIIQSQDFEYTPGTSASGWQIDKNGGIVGTGITILDTSGNILFSSGTTIASSWNDITDKPTDSALLNSFQRWNDITGTGKPADNADVTSQNTAAAIAGQGAFATLSQITSANVSTYIGAAAIDTAYIANAAIQTALIDDLAVSEAKIANLAVTTAKIDDLAVSSAKIDSLAVTTGKIANLAVDTLKVAGEAITSATYTTFSASSGTRSNIGLQSSWEEQIAVIYLDCYAGSNVLYNIRVNGTMKANTETTTARLYFRIYENGVLRSSIYKDSGANRANVTQAVLNLDGSYAVVNEPTQIGVFTPGTTGVRTLTITAYYVLDTGVILQDGNGNSYATYSFTAGDAVFQSAKR
jgi:hypothetical protein